jgi:hypothetical protein
MPLRQEGLIRHLWLDAHHAHRDGPAIGQIERPGHQVFEIKPRGPELLQFVPLVDEHNHARPRVIADFGVFKRPPAFGRVLHGLRVNGVRVALRRPGVTFANVVEPDRCADDILFVNQVPVILIASIQQILRRKRSKIALDAKNVFDHGQLQSGQSYDDDSFPQMHSK